MNADDSKEGPVASNADAPKNGTEPAKYNPKVSTWGVFERPDDISKAYGGGKNIPMGGVKAQITEEQRKKDEKVKQLLAEYRKGLGIDLEKEETHREDIDRALLQFQKLQESAATNEAIRVLESVTKFTSPTSKRGGEVYLNLGMALEAVGRSADAKKIYTSVKRSPFPQHSSRARQLLFGFEAIKTLERREAINGENGLRTMKFKLPDLAANNPKRYDLTFSEAYTPEQREALRKKRAEAEKKQGTAVLVGLAGLILVWVVTHH
eukprot:CAMPEP_0174896830 /NCGR_PEP_ID=MMETSP0167-20121228/10936_1 /TAXON_ID=38298 /ORGANISM="Rhodella maculata, Strain CCMP736" /LENGTH=264 /DNA_ID=CAMNT_0016136501 /DNA_START=129 /DNA_END=923 /DNA_ORIENTATION=-